MTGEWIGAAAATLTTLSFVPQAIRTLRTRDTRGISGWMYATFTVGVALWLVYGLYLHSWPMIVLSMSATNSRFQRCSKGWIMRSTPSRPSSAQRAALASPE